MNYIEKIKNTIFSDYIRQKYKRKEFAKLREQGKLETLLYTPLSEIENKFEVKKTRDDLGLYPSDGCSYF